MDRWVFVGVVLFLIFNNVKFVYKVTLNRGGSRVNSQVFSRGSAILWRKPATGGRWRKLNVSWQRPQGVSPYKRPTGNAVWWDRLNGLPTRVNKQIEQALSNAQMEIMEEVDSRRGYKNLTGNTITSTMSAIHFGNRKPILMGLPSVRGRRPTRGKLGGKAPRISNGRYRGARGYWRVKWFDHPTQWKTVPESNVPIPTNHGHADDEIRRRLLAKNPTFDKHNRTSSFILDVGVEYKNYLEEKGQTVIGVTQQMANAIIMKEIRSCMRGILRK